MYLCIEDGKAELRDAAALWGKNTDETEDLLKATLGEGKGRSGKQVEVACIGPAGKKLSLLAAVVNGKGRAAGRCGVGAVMGCKKLKAIAVSGKAEVPEFDAARAEALRKAYMKRSGGFHDILVKCGTVGRRLGQERRLPGEELGGVGPVDFASGASKYSASR